jgi:uncharacterized protein (DUF697 family)
VKDEVRALIHKTSAWCAGVGVALSPIPLVDEIVLFPVYSVFSARIGKRHGVKWGQMPWRPILKSTTAGLVARGMVNVTVALIPGVSAVASGATAAALTEILGEYYDDACRDPSSAQTLTVRGVVDMLKRAVLKKKDGAPAEAPEIIDAELAPEA